MERIRSDRCEDVKSNKEFAETDDRITEKDGIKADEDKTDEDDSD